jgi:hypothetical protein
MAERKGGNKIGNRRTNLLYMYHDSYIHVMYMYVCEVCATVKRVHCKCKIVLHVCTVYTYIHTYMYVCTIVIIKEVSVYQ